MVIVHTIQEHINGYTYLLFEITSVLTITGDAHSLDITVYILLLSERDWLYHVVHLLCHL